ncbi:unnamed protein product, partial [Prorocentrum cordatum]
GGRPASPARHRPAPVGPLERPRGRHLEGSNRAASASARRPARRSGRRGPAALGMSRRAAALPPPPPSLFWGRYRLGRKLGTGSFGEAFLVVHVRTGEERAVKLERVESEHPMLMYEARLLRRLQGIPGVANVHFCGVVGEYNVMVMDLLGPSLQDLFRKCGGKFSLKTVLMIADQMLYRVEHLHSKGFIHGDIKPSNFLIGHAERSGELHMIDFGLATPYRDLKSHQHIPHSEGKGMSGTARFCSINAHRGLAQSRRDDLEAVGYLLIYFMRGELPWQSVEGGTREDTNNKIMECKRSTPIETLCDGCPAVFATYLSHCQCLWFDARPDYAFLRRLFKDLFLREGFQRDGLFDWSWPDEQSPSSSPPVAAAEECAHGDAAGAGDVAKPALGQAKLRQGIVRSLLRRLSKRRCVA